MAQELDEWAPPTLTLLQGAARVAGTPRPPRRYRLTTLIALALAAVLGSPRRH